MSTRIKICGITRQDDADAVVDAGADALGLNFADASPRRVDTAQARDMAVRVRGVLTRVGVFLDPSREAVARVLDHVDLDLLQFHGDEPAAFCAGFGLPYMKVVHVRGSVPLEDIETEYADACCLMLDNHVAGLAGGTGRSFDWALWPARARLPLVLAGGLTPENVAAAVSELDPWGVDVSSGVEGPVNGEKDPVRIRQFVSEVKRARS